MNRRLIVNADDFGVARAANLGIIECFLAGSVTSTTLMVNAQATEEAAALAKANPTLGVGLHFNLTLGRPISPPGAVDSLVDAHGGFHDRGALARRFLLGAVKRRHVEAELSAQFRRMQALGIQPTHVDSHQHVHGFGLAFDCVAALCVERTIPMRVPWLLRGVGRATFGRSLRQALLATMLRGNSRRWQGKVAWNDAIGSVFDLGLPGGSVTMEAYRHVLLAAPARGVFELMVHPVTTAQDLHGLTSIGDISENEWRVLRAGALREMAQKMGFEMATFETAFN